MIPFVRQPSIHLGPVTIAAFGVIVASAVAVGLALSRRRFARERLDAAQGERLAWWALVGGFVGAHVFSLVFYFPEKLAERPWLLLKLWEDISSTGGVLGGLVGIAWFLHRHAPTLSRGARRAYLDVAAFVFPVSLTIGRLACSLAHDHPGALTRFPLAISLASPRAQAYIADVYRGAGRIGELPASDALARLGFHDLGWYEFLFLAIVVLPLTHWLDRRPRVRGFWLFAFGALYLPGRFALEFLRVADVRYGALTPAQWGALAGLAALPWWYLRLHRQGA